MLLRTGIGLCGAGAVAHVGGAVVDVEAADPWASVAGGVAGLVGLALVIHGLLGQRSTGAATGVTAGGDRSVAAGGSIGSVATGDGMSAATPPSMPTSAPRPANGPVTASGERSVAAGGDIGSVSTGDG